MTSTLLHGISLAGVQCDSCISSSLPCCEVSGGEEQGNFIAQVKGPQGAKCYLQNDIESCTWEFIDNFKPQGDATFGKTEGPNQVKEFEEMVLTSDEPNKVCTAKKSLQAHVDDFLLSLRCPPDTQMQTSCVFISPVFFSSTFDCSLERW